LLELTDMKYGLVMTKQVGFGSSNETVDEVVADTKEQAIKQFTKKYPTLPLDKDGYCHYAAENVSFCVAEVFRS
jgi:hypothetical protein